MPDKLRRVRRRRSSSALVKVQKNPHVAYTSTYVTLKIPTLEFFLLLLQPRLSPLDILPPAV